MPPPHLSQQAVESVAADVARAPRARAVAVAQPLTNGCTQEVLAFLAARPVHSVVMASFIRDNGLESALNRGTFYGCRNAQGRLTGVALIGHTVTFDARNEATLTAFAALARACPKLHMIMGERKRADRFWASFAAGESVERQVCDELMYVQRWPAAVHEHVPGLRRAVAADLETVAHVHAEMAFAESGVNPLKVDPVGFRARTARRIALGRVWVWIEDGRLIFKTDVVAETPEATYLEGVFVNAAERGRGYGLRCLSQMSRELLLTTRSLCLLVSEHNQIAQAFYRRAGYRPHSNYRMIFVRPRP
ncbi:MAG TPA: GNAT family N-acetyltransferase [Pyrinomonadaceae bacterium]|jgi:ribosomal protein S18 acetylase RimI-like enzyme